MISTSPSSQSNTTISSSRPAVSSPSRSSRCGFSSSSGLLRALIVQPRARLHLEHRVCAPTAQRSRLSPLPHGDTNCRRAIQPFAIGAFHELGQLGFGKARRDNPRSLLRTRTPPPPLSQLVNVIASLGLVSPGLHLRVAHFPPLNNALTHALIVLRNTNRDNGPIRDVPRPGQRLCPDASRSFASSSRSSRRTRSARRASDRSARSLR